MYEDTVSVVVTQTGGTHVALDLGGGGGGGIEVLVGGGVGLTGLLIVHGQSANLD